MGPCLHDGRYELRQARNQAQIAAAQALRYRAFMEEGGALADEAGRSLRLDIDRFDAHCDHLIVIDHAASGQDRGGVVGTYRLLGQDAAHSAGGFYSALEFDLACLLGSQGRLLELGRSCVAPEHRGGHLLQLLRNVAEPGERLARRGALPPSAPSVALWAGRKAQGLPGPATAPSAVC